MATRYDIDNVVHSFFVRCNKKVDSAVCMKEHLGWPVYNTMTTISRPEQQCTNNTQSSSSSRRTQRRQHSVSIVINTFFFGVCSTGMILYFSKL